MRWQVGHDDGVDRLEDFYGEFKLVLAVIFSRNIREVLFNVNWDHWVKQHPTQRLTKREQLKYSETGAAPRESDSWSYIHRSETWVLALNGESPNICGPDLIDSDYEQIFTLHTTDYRALPNVVGDSVPHELSILKETERTL